MSELTKELIQLIQRLKVHEGGFYRDLYPHETALLLRDGEERGWDLADAVRERDFAIDRATELRQEVERLKAELAARIEDNKWAGNEIHRVKSEAEAEIERLKAALDEDKAGMYARGLEAEAEIKQLKGEFQTESAERVRCRDGWAQAEARLAKMVEIVGEMADTDPDDGTAWFHERCADALAAAQPEEKHHSNYPYNHPDCCEPAQPEEECQHPEICGVCHTCQNLQPCPEHPPRGGRD